MKNTHISRLSILLTLSFVLCIFTVLSNVDCTYIKYSYCERWNIWDNDALILCGEPPGTLTNHHCFYHLFPTLPTLLPPKPLWLQFLVLTSTITNYLWEELSAKTLSGVTMTTDRKIKKELNTTSLITLLLLKVCKM